MTIGSPAADVVLNVRGLRTELRTRRGTVTAVDGLDLSIHRGEVVALVGESGSGKSMTALSIMRLLPSGAKTSAEALRLGDADLLSLSEKQMNAIRGARLAMLFQQPKATLDPTSPVGDQVSESLRLHGRLSRQEAWNRSVQLLANVGIPEPDRRAQAYAHQMSGGMAQRVMIAAAVSAGPELLIADEPTTALDVTVQAQILRLLAQMRRDSALSMLLITHDLGMVASVADRVAVMYAGQIVEEGSVKAIFEAPQHPYTQALLRSSLLNTTAQGRLYAIPGGPPAPGSKVVGCRFRPRCHVADEANIADRCEYMQPELACYDQDHATRCWALQPELATR